MLELLITMNGGDAKAGLVVDTEGLVHGLVQFLGGAILDWLCNTELDRPVDAGKEGHATNVHEVHAEGQVLVLSLELGWYLDEVFLHVLRGSSRRLPFERSQVWSKDLLCQVRVCDCDRAVLEGVHSNDGLEIL